VNDGARLGILLHEGNLAMEPRILTFPGSIDRLELSLLTNNTQKRY